MRKFEKAITPFLLNSLKLFIPPQKVDLINFPHNQIKNILIVIRHMMGDMLCASPMMRAVREFYPEAKIVLVTKSSTNYQQLFYQESSYVNEVLKYEKGFENFINLIKILQDMNIDLAVVPSTVVFSNTNHLIAYYSKAKYRVGVKSFDYIDNPSGFLLNIASDFNWSVKKIHQIDRNLEIIKQIGIIPKNKLLTLSLRKNDLDDADSFIKENFPDSARKIVGFHPGAGKPENIWNIEKFAELAYLIHKNYNAYLFISEGPQDKNYVRNMKTILLNQYAADCVIGKNSLIKDLSIISKCSLFISNDTGIMHLVSALKVPLIALFGPSNAAEWGPLGENKFAIQSSKNTLDDITVEVVYKLAEKILKN